MLLSGAYIAISSWFLGNIAESPRTHAVVEVAKGVGFVLVTGVALYAILERQFRKITALEAAATTRVAQVARAHQQASLALVTRATTHDVRNLISALEMSVEFVLDPNAPLAERDEAVADVREAFSRLHVMTAELLDRCRHESTEPPRVLDMAEVVKGCLRLAGLFERGHRCNFEQQYEDGCLVVARTRDLELAVLNVILNGIAANGREGTIHVTLHHDDEQAHLTIRDEGAGVPPEIVDRIFEPYFTTKGRRGNGVGLAVSRSLIAYHGGDLVLSSPGPGAEFSILLPLSDHDSAEGDTRSAATAARDEFNEHLGA